MTYAYHKDFKKSYKKLTPKLRSKVDQKLLLFRQSPFATELHNHALVGAFSGYRSINITGDYRAIYREVSDDMIIFARLGTHSQLY